MHIFKNLKIALIIFALLSGTYAKATEECFEGVSRSIFKFNMAFDDMILEPIANGYNKLPEPIKKGTSNFTSNIAVLLSIPNSLDKLTIFIRRSISSSCSSLIFLLLHAMS